MYRTTCRACGKKKLFRFLDLGKQPLAGGFLPPEADAIEQEKRHHLPIDICENCGLIQTPHVIPPKLLFTNYCFSSSTIPALVSHFTDYAKWIKKRFDPKRVVEFGSNDGILLLPLKKLGIESIGVDISKNITEIAKNKGLNAIQGFFDEPMALKIKKNTA